jgi:uncharacterized protein
VKRRGDLFMLVVGIAIALGAHACVESSSSTTSGASSSTTAAGGVFDKAALLDHLGSAVILATYEQFVKDAAALEDAAASYAGSLSAADREAVQDAWRKAMSTWERAELMQIGPAGVSGVVAGGQDLRDHIYSWPLVNRCRVDQELVEQAYANVDAFAAEHINVRGLDALEYLLFYDGTTNACAPQNDINATGAWNAVVAEIPARRAAYALTLATLLHRTGAQLRDAWAPAGGAFVNELATAGSGSTIYGTQRDGLNAVSDALFYLEKETKDEKLAIPLGVLDCPTETCPNALELRLAPHSKQAIAENIAGFRLLFTGGPASDDLGFDDWLTAYGASDVAASIISALDEADAALAAIEEDDLAITLANDPESLAAVHSALKLLATELKTRFVSILDLELPKSVEGDND